MTGARLRVEHHPEDREAPWWLIQDGIANPVQGRFGSKQDAEAWAEFFTPEGAKP